MSQVFSALEHVRGEPLTAPIVINNDPATLMTRLSPVVDRFAIVTDNMAMTNAVWCNQASVEKLEPLLTASCSGNDLDWPAFELVTPAQASG